MRHDAEKIIEIHEKWINTSSNVIADNLNNILDKMGYNTWAKKMELLSRITDSSKHTTYAWLNHGRKNVKIPFLKVCMIAKELKIDINKILYGEKSMFEKKFAVTRTVGNNEKILKFFNEDEKEEALLYGAAVAKDNTEGVITCMLAQFDKKNRMKNEECEVYEVWE